MKIERTETVAVIVDYQEKLMPVMNKTEEILHNAEILMEGLRILEIPMVVTQQYPKGLGETVSELQSIIKGAGEVPIIDKIRFSGFEDVESYLQAYEPQKKYAIVCGVEAHICVLQTVIDLIANGYTAVLVTDCISSRKEQDCLCAIERAKQEGAIVTTYEALLFELLQKAGTDESRKIQKLIR